MQYRIGSADHGLLVQLLRLCRQATVQLHPCSITLAPPKCFCCKAAQLQRIGCPCIAQSWSGLSTQCHSASLALSADVGRRVVNAECDDPLPDADTEDDEYSCLTDDADLEDDQGCCSPRHSTWQDAASFAGPFAAPTQGMASEPAAAWGPLLALAVPTGMPGSTSLPAFMPSQYTVLGMPPVPNSPPPSDAALAGAIMHQGYPQMPAEGAPGHGVLSWVQPAGCFGADSSAVHRSQGHKKRKNQEDSEVQKRSRVSADRAPDGEVRPLWPVDQHARAPAGGAANSAQQGSSQKEYAWRSHDGLQGAATQVVANRSDQAAVATDAAAAAAGAAAGEAMHPAGLAGAAPPAGQVPSRFAGSSFGSSRVQAAVRGSAGGIQSTYTFSL